MSDISDYKIVSRPGGIYWAPLGFLSLIALAPLLRLATQLSGVDEQGIPGGYLLFLLLLLVAWILSGIYVSCNVVIADVHGLRWRYWKPWRFDSTWQSCTWSEVSDFYLATNSNGAASVHGIHVKIGDDRLVTIGVFWTKLARLREYIAEQAIQVEIAKDVDGNRAMLLHGIRPADLPLTLDYDVGALRNQRRGTILSYVGISLFFFTLLGGFCLTLVFTVKESSGLAAALVLGGLCLFVLALSSWQAWCEVKDIDQATEWASEGRKIVVTREGMTLWQEGESSFIPWETVIGWDLARCPYKHPMLMVRIVLEFGREVIVSSRISRFALLYPLLRMYATEGVEYRITHNQANAIGGISQRWSGGEEGKGARVFRALTKSGFAGLAALLMLPSLFGFALIRTWIQLHTLEGMEILVAFTAVLLIFPLIYLVWLLIGRIEVDKTGLALTNLRGRQTANWEEITRYNVQHGIYLETSGGKKLEFSPISYAYGSELPALITENIERVRRARER